MTKAFWAAVVIFTGTAFAADSITFHKDIEPILQNNCQSCHRPGQAGPMSLLSYENVRPWAKAMKNAVVTRKMPPWFADARYGHFANDRSLKQTDIDTIARWADLGAPEGDAKDAPAAVNWPKDGWEIQPDFVVNGPEFAVPAKPKANVIEWTYITVPSGLTEDTWVTSMEIRPSEPSVTHHICVYFKPHLPDTQYNTPVWSERSRDEKGLASAEAAGVNGRKLPESVLKGAGGVEGCYVPGQFTQDYRLFRAAKLVKAGSDIVFQLHYTPNGKDVVDRPRVGFTVAKAPAERNYVTIVTSAASDATSFAIPPHAANWESPPMEAEFLADAELVSMFPHMHMRGKDMSYQLIFPNGETETLLKVPRYDFNWQMGYDVAQPIKIPKGTRILVTAHFDNSANNKFNPDPEQTVYYGDMTWEEMMTPFFSVTVAPGVDTRKVIRVVRGEQKRGGA
jgi:Copper type II ascorbate-dependent monooxygenase, C-terminal domain